MAAAFLRLLHSVQAQSLQNSLDEAVLLEVLFELGFRLGAKFIEILLLRTNSLSSSLHTVAPRLRDATRGMVF